MWVRPEPPKPVKKRQRGERSRGERAYEQGIVLRPSLVSVGMEMERFLKLVFPRSPLYRFVAYAIMLELKHSDGPVVSINPVREKHGIPHASFYRVLRALRKAGIVRHGYRQELRQYFLARDFSNALKRLAGRYEEFLAEKDRFREERYLRYLKDMAGEYFPEG